MKKKSNRKFHISFFEAFDEEQRIIKELLKDKGFSCFYTEKTIQDNFQSDDMENTKPESNIISLRTQSYIPTSWGKELDAILTRSTGYDHLKHFKQRTTHFKRKISMCHLPDYSKRSVAEEAIILMGNLLRKMKLQLKNFENFYRDGMTGREIKNRKIVVVGVGRIGGQVVDIAKGLRMNVVGVDIVENEELKKRLNLKYLPLDEALNGSEVIISCLPLTEKTNCLLNYKKLSTMKKGSVLVNVGRGEVTPTKDLFQLMKDGIIAGVALDVFQYEKELASVLRKEKKVNDIMEKEAKEAVEISLKMMKMENVLFTPHNAFNTMEAVERKCKFTVQNYLNYVSKGEFVTPI